MTAVPRGRLAWVALLGLLVFIAVAVAGIQRAWTHRAENENPALVAVIVWLAAGIAHALVPRMRAACAIATGASVLAYAVIVIATNAVNEMFVSGMIVVGILGFAVSLIVGLAVAACRRSMGHPDEPRGSSWSQPRRR